MNNLRKLFVLGVTFAILLFTIGCDNDESSGPMVNGSGNLETQQMDYSDFTRIEIGHAFQAEITRADSFSVNITLDDNLFDHLITDVRGDTLYIGLETNFNYRNTTEKATITIPDLSALKLSGASSGDVSGFISADSLQIEVSGASSVFFKDIEVGDTQFNISGASHVSGKIKVAECGFLVSGASSIELQGSASDASINTSGSSTMSLDDFVVGSANILLSGASVATINVTGTLDVNVGGVCSLEYFGNPTLGTVIVSDTSTMRQG